MKTNVWLLAVSTIILFTSPLSRAPQAWGQKAETKTVAVFAAASLKNALDEAGSAYAASSGNKVSASYASSAALAKQIEQAAPADIFVSADLEWMDYVSAKGLIDNATRKNLLGNTLVLIAPAASSVGLKIEPGFALAGALADGRLAVGEVKSVPAGKYAKSALEALGVWKAVEDKLAPTDNVRAALALVAQGEAPLGIVYKTDAASEPKVKIVAEFPEGSHAPIVYPIAVTKSASQPDAAKSLLSFLQTPEATKIFAKHGFKVLQ